MKLRWYSLLGVAAGLLIVLTFPMVVQAIDAEPVEGQMMEGVPDADITEKGLKCGTWHWKWPLWIFCKREHIDDLDGPYRPCSNIKIGGQWYHIESVWDWITWVRPVYNYQPANPVQTN